MDYPGLAILVSAVLVLFIIIYLLNTFKTRLKSARRRIAGGQTDRQNHRGRSTLY